MPARYAWSDVHNAADNVAAFVRTGDGGSVAVAANFAPVVREGYLLRLPHAGPVAARARHRRDRLRRLRRPARPTLRTPPTAGRP